LVENGDTPDSGRDRIMKEARDGRRRLGRLLERDWSELIVELFWGMIRLAARGFRSFFD
jgi:hypothetical protein